MLTGARVGLLGEEAERGREREQPLEHPLRVLHPSQMSVGVDQPEGAREERPLGAADPIIALVDVVAVHQVARAEPARHRVDGAGQPVMPASQEAELGESQRGGIEHLAAQGLGEGAEPRREAFDDDATVDGAPG